MTKDELDNVDFEEVMVIDIRNDDEVDALPALEKVVHIPMSEVVKKVDDETLPKDKKIVTICGSGARCLMLNQMLTEHGYDADYLEGGMMELKKGE